MIRVNGLFLDYESVIDPLHLSKKQSKFPSHLETLLNKIGRNIPIGVITTRDLPFIIAQTKFAHAWSAIGGLEIKIGNQLFISHGAGDVLPFLNQSLRYARKYIRDGIVIEEKHNYSGQTVAFTINWQTAKDEKAASASYSRIVAYCKSLPLNVIEYPGNSFVDVFPHPINKGKTLKELKDDLGLAGGILYISGSDIDNVALLYHRIMCFSITILHRLNQVSAPILKTSSLMAGSIESAVLVSAASSASSGSKWVCMTGRRGNRCCICRSGWLIESKHASAPFLRP